MTEQIKSYRVTPENISSSKHNSNNSPTTTEKTSYSHESLGMIQGFIYVAKNFLERLRKDMGNTNVVKEPSSIPSNIIKMASVPTCLQKLDDANKPKKKIREILRSASVSVAKMSKANSPLCSEYYSKRSKSSNHSYKFSCKNMNKTLADAVGVKINSEKESEDNNNIVYEPWIQPSTHGLENSPRIVPEYYMGTNIKNKLLTIDYHYMILDDIRNLRPLSKTQLDYIEQQLNETEKHDIIIEMNNVIAHFCFVHQD